jgi:hypothetical protein
MRGAAPGRGAPDLRVSWTDFASLYGEEELRREREAWLEQRRSRSRGTNHEQRWQQFRAAIENYTPQVRPGNQTALNTRADPFAAYLAEVHRRIHARFADSFLHSLPSTVDAAFRANPAMHAKLELAFDPEGRVARIGIVATSGDILFDFGAYNAVMMAQPYAASPEAIRSPDGLVYVHWSFYRNERQCGTFNAEPYILAGVPLRDEGEPATPLGAPFGLEGLAGPRALAADTADGVDAGRSAADRPTRPRRDDDAPPEEGVAEDPYGQEGVGSAD